MTGSIITNKGREIMIDRVFSASPTLGLPTTMRGGINESNPSTTTSALTTPVPLAIGTVNDTCEDVFTGSNGGDNSTDNTTTFKEGAGQSDDTSQNLITNATSATKTWTITPDTNFITTEPFGFWIYIIDATTLAYFLSSGTALEIKIGSDSSNYYSKTWTASQLATGWNWLETGTTVVNTLTETGTVSGNLDTLIVEITTNNATDSWSSADVVIDLFRQWSTSDLEITPESGYPSVDLTNREVTTRYRLGPTIGSGYSYNTWTHETTDNDLFSIFVVEERTKTDDDEFIIQTVHRAR